MYPFHVGIEDQVLAIKCYTALGMKDRIYFEDGVQVLSVPAAKSLNY